MPRGTGIGISYPTSGGKHAGTNLHRSNPSGGDNLGNGQHKVSDSKGGANMASVVGPGKGSSPSEPRPRKRLRGSKGPTKAMPGQPIIGKSGGSLGGQTLGKIV